jgi:hypothetical protein
MIWTQNASGNGPVSYINSRSDPGWQCGLDRLNNRVFASSVRHRRRFGRLAIKHLSLRSRSDVNFGVTQISMRTVGILDKDML